MAIRIARLTDSNLFLDCDCGEKIISSSKENAIECTTCFSKVNTAEARKLFIETKLNENIYTHVIEKKKNNVRNKFNSKYGNVEELTRKLRSKKRV